MEKYKKVIQKTNLKYQLQRGMMNLNYLMVHILYQIFKTILNIFLKIMKRRMIILQQEFM